MTNKPPKATGLRYLGTDASQWLPGVPARDIPASEVEALGLDVEALTAPHENGRPALYERGAVVDPPTADQLAAATDAAAAQENEQPAPAGVDEGI